MAGLLLPMVLNTMVTKLVIPFNRKKEWNSLFITGILLYRPAVWCFYTSDSIPEWKNNLFIACLSSLHINRLVIENNKVVGEESLLLDKKERFRDVCQSNGKLYAVTDGGILFRISKK